ncbi:MAG TPA: hypothetical protein VN426_04460 [Syntrophomonadaceae bacterium]|nr:hypothetical protein [Syntrophomonadaceae bacterium]
MSTIITSKPPVYSISGRTLSISTQFGQKVNFSDINNIQLKDSLPGNLNKTDGLGIGTVLKGKFSSDIGNISVYVNTAIPQFIYIGTTSGLIIVNDQSVAKTQALYNELNTDINNK